MNTTNADAATGDKNKSDHGDDADRHAKLQFGAGRNHTSKNVCALNSSRRKQCKHKAHMQYTSKGHDIHVKYMWGIQKRTHDTHQVQINCQPIHIKYTSCTHRIHNKYNATHMTEH